MGRLTLLGGVDTLLFTSVVTPQIFNVRFANRTTVAVAVRLAIGSGDSPQLVDYVDYDVTVPPNGVLEDTGLVASSGEKVWARSSAAGVSVRAHGM